MGNTRASVKAGFIVAIVVGFLCGGQMIADGKDPVFSVIIGLLVGALSGILVAAGMNT